MKDGYIRAAAASFEVCPGDCRKNAAKIINIMRECEENKISLVVFPELCVSGFSCGDLFLQQYLIEDSRRALSDIASAAADLYVLAAVGVLWERDGKLFNAAAVLQKGRVLGIVPKSFIPAHTGLCGEKYFTPARETEESVSLFGGAPVPFGTDLIFRCRQLPGFAAAFEIGEDILSPFAPSARHAAAGALIIGNLSADTESAEKPAHRKDAVRMQSARLCCAYLYSSAGAGESSTDFVFSGHRVISENGGILSERLYGGGEDTEIISAEIDTSLLTFERRRTKIFSRAPEKTYRRIDFDITPRPLRLTRVYRRAPFLPPQKENQGEYCDMALNIQARGLAARAAKVKPRRLILGVSGGLDSALALMVSAKALEMLKRPPSDIIALTMPGPGTTADSLERAKHLCRAVGASLRVIDINGAVKGHLADIGHGGAPDTAYENAQARERMQILMDTANMEGGFVVGTPDLSEIALGFSTYGGDHMSMYGVNSGVPKTLVRAVVSHIAANSEGEPGAVLADILSAPPSPELLPAGAGENPVRTEDVVGDYILHDFILYYFIRYGFSPQKILRLLRRAFHGKYSDATLESVHKTFFRRFYANQFKRSCMPDGPKVCGISLSPRGGFNMPGDMDAPPFWDDNTDDNPDEKGCRG